MFKNNLDDLSKKIEQYQNDLKVIEQLRIETAMLFGAYNAKQKAFAKSIEAAEKSMDDVLTMKHINTLSINEATRQMKKTQMH